MYDLGLRVSLRARRPESTIQGAGCRLQGAGCRQAAG
jgi:hypothetical protein